MMRFTGLLLCLCFAFATQAQLAVQKGLTAQQLGNNLAGANITILNPTITGNTDQYGLFSYVGNDLGLSSGVILSTGDIDDAVGPNTDEGTTTAYGRPGDPDLTALAGFPTEDAVVLEFEFEVQGDELEFNFIFLSEEYNEFVNSGFNDVFAFYISGPGIVGQENLAVVPGTTTPVTINSINNNSFFQFFVNNDSSVTNQVNTSFDGFTTLMKARRTNLTPCGVYRLSLRLADGSDDQYDSGVLLQENSLVSNSIAVNSATVSTDTTALEGCIPASFTFNLGATASSDLNIPIRLGGTALNGVDYVFIDSIITIPRGQTASTLLINALADGITEGRETIELYYSPSPCAPEDTVLLYIDDATPLTFDAIGSNLGCNGDSSGSIAINISGGTAPYTVTYIDTSTGVQQNIAAANLPITGLSAGAYLLRVADQYGCSADAVVVGGSFNAGQTFLPDGTGVSYTSAINISGFNTGQSLTAVNQINSVCATMEHSYAGDLTIELIAPSGQVIQLKNVGATGSGVNTCDMGEPIASGPVDNAAGANLSPGVGYQYCWTNTPTYPTMGALISPVAPGPPPIHTFTTLAGNTYTDYYLPAGSYTPRQGFIGLLGTSLNGNWTLRVTDNFAQDNGYIFDWSLSLQTDLPDSIVILTEPAAPVISHTSTAPSCGLSDGSIDLNVVGSHPPFTYLWSNGATTEDLTAIAAGTYDVVVTDTVGCSYTYSVNLSNSGAVAVTATVNGETCANVADGSIDLNVGAGVFSFAWSTGATTEDLTALSPGTYTVTITDGSCVAVEQYVVQAAPALISAATLQNETCGDQEGEISLQIRGAQGAVTYQWSTGDSTANLTDLQQGLYIVTISDANGCNLVDSFQLINLVGNCIPSCDLSITSFLVSNETCGDATGGIDLSVFSSSGPIAYAWSNGATTQDLNNISAGNYTITVSDAISCQDTLTVTVTNQTNGLVINNFSATDELCSNRAGALTVAVSGGAQPYTYLWNTGATTASLSSLNAGAYTVSITDGAGCLVQGTGTVGNNTGDLVQTYGNAVDEVCGNGQGSIDIIATSSQTPLTYLWSNGATTEDLVGLSAGTYQATITDASSCRLLTPVYTVNNASGNFVMDNIDIDDEVCSNGRGDITIAVLGGQTPYTYLWNTGATTAVLSNLSVGTYTATVTDSNGCALTTGPLVLNNNSGNLSLDNVQVLDEICNSQTGAVNLTISGNAGPLTYNWNNNSTAPSLNNLVAGQYNATITDTLGCIVLANATVNNQAGSLNIANMVASAETCGQADGAISLVLGGATAPIVYNWSNGATTAAISNVSAGQYTVTVSDASGCSVVATRTVGAITTNGLALGTPTIQGETCGDGSGSISVVVTGSSMPYTYLWNNGGTTATRNGLSAGAYTATITDASGCSLVAGPYTINNNAGTLAATAATTDEQCGNAGGAITITTIGGTAPYTYAWSNSATTASLSGLTAGLYSVTISDANGCAVVVNTTINNTTGALAITNAAIVDEQCSNGAGNIAITATGGTMPYTYAWSNGGNTATISNLAAINYTLTLTDANGCALITTYNVGNNPGNLQVASINTTDENCSDGTGSIDVTLTGGTFPLTYAWSNGANTEDITNLNAGVYLATVTDANACVLRYGASLQNNAGNLTYMDSVVAATCGNTNGTIALQVVGGTAPYTYAWSNGATSATIVGVTAGNYSCVITDAAGCTTYYNGNVPNQGGNFALQSSNVLDDVCGQGTGQITATVVGGGQPYTYNWASTSTTTCCTYTLRLLDLNNNGWGGNPVPSVDVYVGGTLYGNFTIPVGQGNRVREYSIPVCTGDLVELEYIAAAQNGNNAYLLLGSTGDTLFSDGPNPLSGTIGYTGTANCGLAGQGTTTLSNLVAGTYLLTATDTNNCTIQDSFVVNNSVGLLGSSLVALQDETCGQGNGVLDISLTGVNNASITWSNGATTEDLANLNAGTYTLVLSDTVTGCTTVDRYTVMNNTNGLLVSDTTITNESCANGAGAIDLTLAGGVTPYSFIWDNGAGTEDITGLSAGIYTVTIVDNAGCRLVENYTVGNNANGLVANTTASNALCGNANGALDLIVTGGTTPYTYTWSNGATTEDLAAIVAGIYVVTITDATGCILLQQDTVWSNNSPANFSAVVTDAFCGTTGGISITATGAVAPVTYNWSTGATTTDITGVGGGAYDVTITEGNGCVSIQSYVVQSSGTFGVGDTVIVDEFCGNGSGSIDLNNVGAPFGPPATFVWSTGGTTNSLTNLTAGTYTVTITRGNFNPCTIVETYIVNNQAGAVSIDTLVLTNETCSQSNGTIDATTSPAGLTFLWSNGATIEDLTNLQAGTYILTATASNGCTAVDSITLLNSTFGFGISNAQVVDEQCSSANGRIDLTVAGGSAPYTYLWSNSATTEDLTNLSAGTYTVTITDNTGCIVVQSYLINNHTLNSSATTIDQGCTASIGSIDLMVTGGTSPYTYLWSNAVTTEDLANLAAGTYTVTITDAVACVAINSFTVGTAVSTVANNAVVVPAACGASTGSIDNSPSGGGAPYSFVWSTGATTEDLGNLAPGSYQVTITDALGCSFVDNIVVSNGAGNLNYNINTTPSTCGLDNGSLTIQVQSGTAPYSFAWSTGATTATINNLAAGSYRVTVSDASGCSSAATANIIALPGSVNLVSADTSWASCATCNDGGIDLLMAGGPYIFSWSNGQTSEDLVNVLPGTYGVTITTINNCQLDTSFTVDFSVGISKLPNLGMQIYPNPTNGRIVIEFEQVPTEALQVEVLDVLGRQLSKDNYTVNQVQQQQSIDLNTLPSAVYFIRVSTDSRSSTQRIVLQKE
ncbi:MAG: choice-of-anchor L domain-containing protein [Aureispira sp.]